MAKISAKLESNIDEFLAELHNDFVGVQDASANALAEALEYGKQLVLKEAVIDARSNFALNKYEMVQATKGLPYKRGSTVPGKRGFRTPHPEGNKPTKYGRILVQNSLHDKKIMMRTGDFKARFAPVRWRSMLRKERELAQAELVVQPRSKGGRVPDFGQVVYKGDGGHPETRHYIARNKEGWTAVFEFVGHAGVRLRVMEYGRRIDLTKRMSKENRINFRPIIGNTLRKGMRQFARYAKYRKRI